MGQIGLRAACSSVRARGSVALTVSTGTWIIAGILTTGMPGRCQGVGNTHSMDFTGTKRAMEEAMPAMPDTMRATNMRQGIRMAEGMVVITNV